jgi:hypothetical protein
LGEVRHHPDNYILQNGEKIKKPYGTIEVDGKKVMVEGDFDTFKAAALEKLSGEKVKPAAAMKFEVRMNSRTGEVFINKVGDPFYRKLKTFTKLDEARKFVNERHADLVQAWEGVKEMDNVKETDVRGVWELGEPGRKREGAAGYVECRL